MGKDCIFLSFLLKQFSELLIAQLSCWRTIPHIFYDFSIHSLHLSDAPIYYISFLLNSINYSIDLLAGTIHFREKRSLGSHFSKLLLRVGVMRVVLTDGRFLVDGVSIYLSRERVVMFFGGSVEIRVIEIPFL